jgi:hypothetical protein
MHRENMKLTSLDSVHPRLLALTLRNFTVSRFCFGHFPLPWVVNRPQLFENHIPFCHYVEEVLNNRTHLKWLVSVPDPSTKP